MSTIISSTEYGEWASGMGMDANPNNLSSHLESVTREVQRICGREFIPTTEESRAFIGDLSPMLYIDDCISITSVVTAGSALVPVSDYVLEPRNSLPTTALRRIFYVWDDTLDTVVTGVFGYAATVDAIPADVKEAACMLVGARVLLAAPIQAATNGIKRTSVVNVTMEYDTNGGLPTIQAFRQMARERLDGYIRIGVPND